MATVLDFEVADDRAGRRAITPSEPTNATDGQLTGPITDPTTAPDRVVVRLTTAEQRIAERRQACKDQHPAGAARSARTSTPGPA